MKLWSCLPFDVGGKEEGRKAKVEYGRYLKSPGL